MIVILRPNADASAVKRALIEHGQWTVAMDGGFILEAHSSAVDPAALRAIPGVLSVSVAPSAWPRVDAQSPIVDVNGVPIGRDAPPVLMSGPCAIESEARIDHIASKLVAHGVRFLRGGAFKPRTSPYAFQGHGESALGWIRRAADRHAMRVVTEVMSEGEVQLVAEYADLLQIGSRNMSNYALLKAVGRAAKPVMLKRSMSATISEWLQAGEYLLVHGASGVIFCERGVRSWDPTTRNLLDLGAVALLAHAHGLPVIVDPSHATGRRDLVLPLARAALAAGAAGVMIETHDEPGCALSDGPQALRPEDLSALTSYMEKSR
ncbi:MAG: 3-deoxy-7-phosphoheptulonate synthase [Deltaproteobacteria bacterium]|nr:3-deoxy-7-phosphoheptulonate synthase [Deltaproteobacteria bacterium]